MRDQLQQTLGDAFTVERELGGGGMSRVFVARDNTLGRQVAIKVFSPDLAAGVSLDRFKREIMLVAALQHPHVVGVLSAGESHGLPYFIMPFVEGESLRAQLKRSGPLPIAEALRILKDVARAMVYAHERGIVHRDVKPDNVLLSSGSAMLTDFGVAKALDSAQLGGEGAADDTLTRVGTSLGTPAYMAPEQAAADTAADHRADIYAFGVMAYEMLAGRPPFHGRSPQALMAAHLVEPPPPLEPNVVAPAALTALIMRCLEKDPADRPQTAAELADALEQVGTGTGLRPAVRSPWRVRRSARLVGGVGIALLAVTSIGVLAIRGRSAAPSEAPPANAIAVLPLVNVGGDSADAYFADGMTDELISALSKVPGLRVASRTAAFRFKGSTASPSEIGKALRVATLLEGAVRRGGSRLRVTAQLVDIADGLALWSETYERELRDVFAVQDSISQAIVSALQTRLGSAGASRPRTTRGTEDLDAYDLYLRGRFLFEQRGEEALLRALDYFQQAAARDSAYAAPWAGMANVYVLLPLYGSTSSDSVEPLALRAVDRAIVLDSGLAGAYAARGALLNAAWRWTDAAADLRRATTLDPNYATAHQWYGENRLVNGDVDEAVRALGVATTLDPLSPVMAASHAVALATARRTEEAIARGRRAVELDPSSLVARFLVGAVYLYGNRADAAIDELETALELSGGLVVVKGLLGYAYAVSGRQPEARAVLASIDSVALGNANAASIARIHLGLGDIDRALTWLERAVDQRDSFFSSESMAAPLFDPLRRHPRFAELVRRVNVDVEALVGR